MTFDRRLETERLCLRGLSAADKPFVFALMGDEDVRRFLGGPVPIARREAAASGYFVTDEGAAVWLVETKDALRPVGLVFISKHRDGEDSELSYQFNPDAWGMGYAIEATRRVLDYAVNDLRLDRLIAETQSANEASRRLLARLGMTEQRRVQRFGAEQIIYASGAPPPAAQEPAVQDRSRTDLTPVIAEIDGGVVGLSKRPGPGRER